MNKEQLSFTYNVQLKRESEEKRKDNIKAFSELDREGLEHGKLERRLFLYEKEALEKIWIQYPGKETRTGRPWDFRPKMQMLGTDEMVKDLSFPDIWDDIVGIHTSNPELLEVLATIFLRMAYMVGYKKIARTVNYDDIDIERKTVVNRGTLNLAYYVPLFNTEILDGLQEEIGKLRGVSLHAYLLYNDLLVQNEDCKYYYRDMVAENAPGVWKPDTGRRNTMLTHLSVIDYIRGGLTFSHIMMKFQRGRGVAPALLSSFPEITGNLVDRG